MHCNILIRAKKKRFIVYCNIDYTSKLYSGATEAEIDSHWSNSFKALFQRSEFLNSALLAQRLAQDRIAVHTRFTALLADFQDSTTKYISETRKSEIMASLLRKIDTIGNRNGSTKIYVFSDSIKFLNYIRFNSDYLVLEGTPAHLDIHSEDLKMELHLKTFIDFFAIAESDEIVLLKTKEMYHSAFPKYASKIYGRKFSLIETL